LNARAATLATVLVFIVGLAVLTVAAAIRDGVTILTFVSLLVLALFCTGVIGALLSGPPPED
jgi:VIT1/CCC1 family predicted Fe2+/Mn2+ transporter